MVIIVTYIIDTAKRIMIMNTTNTNNSISSNNRTLIPQTTACVPSQRVTDEAMSQVSSVSEAADEEQHPTIPVRATSLAPARRSLMRWLGAGGTFWKTLLLKERRGGKGGWWAGRMREEGGGRGGGG